MHAHFFTLTPFLICVQKCHIVTLYGMLISVLIHRLCMSLSVFYMYLFIVDSISYIFCNTLHMPSGSLL